VSTPRDLRALCPDPLHPGQGLGNSEAFGIDAQDVEGTWREVRGSRTDWLRYEPDEVEQRLLMLRNGLAFRLHAYQAALEHHHAKRALEVAAAGGHNLLTLWAQRPPDLQLHLVTC
jgi:hypothetical protein